MKSGVYTFLNIVDGSPVLKDVSQKVCLIGPPLRTTDKKILGTQVKISSTNPFANGDGTNFRVKLDANNENGLKTNISDELLEIDGIRKINFYVRGKGEKSGDEYAIAKSNGFIDLPQTDADNYNTNPSKEVVTFPLESFIRSISEHFDIKIIGSNGIMTITGNDKEDFIKLIKKGMVFYVATQGKPAYDYALITNVNKATYQFTIDNDNYTFTESDNTERGIAVDYYGIKSIYRVVRGDLLGDVTFSVSNTTISVSGTNNADYCNFINDNLNKYLFYAYGKNGSDFVMRQIIAVSGTDLTIDNAMTEVYSIIYDYYNTSSSGQGYKSPVLLFDLIALRKAGEGFHAINGIDDVRELFDVESIRDKDSILAFSSGLVATQGIKFYIYGLKMSGSGITDPLVALVTLDLWTETYDTLLKKKEAYHIVPLTPSSQVLTSFRAFILNANQPENQAEKRLYVSHMILNEGNGPIRVDAGTFGNLTLTVKNIDAYKGTCVIEATGTDNTEFIDRIKLNDVFQVAYQDGTQTYNWVYTKISSIDAQNKKFTVDEIVAPLNVDLTGDWYIYYPLGDEYANSGFDAENDTTAAESVPATYDNEAITLVGPYYATMGDYVLEGYHLAAITASAISSKRLGYCFTRETVPLIDKIMSIDYFNDGETGHKERLKNAGWMLIDQKNESASPFYYHQSTTKTSDSNRMEMSLNIVHHAIMKTIRETYDQYIARGLTNRINPNDPNDPATIAYNKMLEKVIKAVYSRYASPDLGIENRVIANIKYLGSYPSESNKTLTIVKIEIEDLYPVNRINVYIAVK